MEKQVYLNSEQIYERAENLARGAPQIDADNNYYVTLEDLKRILESLQDNIIK